MRDVWSFITAVWAHIDAVSGVTLTIGGVALRLAEWWYPSFQAPVVQPWHLITSGLVLTFYACFRTWRDERAARVKAEARLERDEPDLRGYINFLAFENPVEGKCTAYAMVSVENAGKRSSIAHNWRITIHEPDGAVRGVRIKQPLHNETVTTTASASGQHLEIPASEFISEKAYRHPIASGGGRRGFLRFEVPANLPAETRYVLTFRDVDRRLYVCEFDPAERRERFNDVKDLNGWAGVEFRRGRLYVP